MVTVQRVVFAFLLGALAGGFAMGWFFRSGAGDFVLKPSPIVQGLERELEEAEAQRDQLGRRLADLTQRAEESEAKFRALDERIHALMNAAEESEAPSAALGVEAEGE